MSNFLEGEFLIASPYLPDGNFLRTVIYMVRHDSEGAFGLVLTRPTELSLSDVMESTLGSSPLRVDLIYQGGPVEGPLCALHEDANLADLECSENLFVTSEQDLLLTLANRVDVRAKFFAGYSGWGPGQLEAELERGGWLTFPATADDIFGNSDDLWEDLVKRVGRSILMEAVPTAGPNSDPHLN